LDFGFFMPEFGHDASTHADGLDWVYSPQADARFVLFLLCRGAFSDLVVA
jgi:hypothetical protein